MTATAQGSGPTIATRSCVAEAPVHPCQTCGACCAAFRVSFYWTELESGGGAVPDALAEQVSPFRAALAGTARGVEIRCAALEGTVGRATSCTIYERRPSPCREVRPSFEDGAADEKCDRARAHHGLPPLTPADWR